MLKTFLDWLRGLGRPPATAPPAAAAAFAQLNHDAPLRATVKAEDDPHSPPVTYLCRETILGRDQRIAGYQFMLHEGTRNHIRHSSRRIQHVYAEVLVRNLAHADIGRLLGHRLAFIEVPDSFLDHPCLADLPAAHMVLMLTSLPDVGALPAAALAERIDSLREAGFRIAVPDPLQNASAAPLLTHADVVVARAPALDALHELELRRLMARSAPHARLLIRDLPALEDFRFAFRIGAALFQGPFITSREDWTEHDLSPSTLRITRLLRRLRENGETHDLAALLKEDAALALRLLRYVNAAANAFVEPISSIEHALVILGRERLQRWLILLSCSTAGQDGRAASALETALIRARMMELLADGETVAQCEALFLVGLLSLADVIMQTPLDKALAPLALADDIGDALLHARGPLYPLLALAIACERGHGDAADLRRAAAACGISPQQATACHLEAMAWAMTVQD
ncbi:EAL and HDOD domain-containing protein [Pseudothauera lacus]|uniref:Signal transduction protein n=1 Tax=Pseudothauera lacus TaxID=2136175 RepID=A0A2T4IFA2_9RHOO|nr:HDOD domain-containing protein [Pseudothauera lacus]PTD96453.1 signal transduction protein [Pseudothauera lacus]